MSNGDRRAEIRSHTSAGVKGYRVMEYGGEAGSEGRPLVDIFPAVFDGVWESPTLILERRHVYMNKNRRSDKERREDLPKTEDRVVGIYVRNRDIPVDRFYMRAQTAAYESGIPVERIVRDEQTSPSLLREDAIKIGKVEVMASSVERLV